MIWKNTTKNSAIHTTLSDDIPGAGWRNATLPLFFIASKQRILILLTASIRQQPTTSITRGAKFYLLGMRMEPIPVMNMTLKIMSSVCGWKARMDRPFPTSSIAMMEMETEQ